MALPAFRARTMFPETAGTSMKQIVPATTVKGDTLLAAVQVSAKVTIIGPGSGWVEVAAQKIVAIEEWTCSVWVLPNWDGVTTEYTWTWGGASKGRHGWIASFSGADLTNPVSAVSNATIKECTPASTVATIDAYTTPTNENRLVQVLFNNEGRAATPPANYTEFADQTAGPAGNYKTAGVEKGEQPKVEITVATQVTMTLGFALQPPQPVQGKGSGSGSGSGTAKGTRGRQAKGTGSGTGGSTSSGTRGRQAKGSGSGTGSGAAKGARGRQAKGTGTGQGFGAGSGILGRQGKGTGQGSGGGSGKGARGRTASAQGSGAGGGSATGTAIKPEQGNPMRVRELIPMHLHLLATTPSGKTYRWAEDGDGPNVIEDLSDSSSVPGGNKDLTASLARKPGIDYGDMKRGTRIEVYGAGRMKLSEFRLERAPQISGDRLQVTPAASGYEAHLLDDSSAQEIFIDADIGAWGETSARRRAEVTTNKYNNSQVSVLPAGTPDPANLSSFLRVPAISHAWSSINNNGGANPDVAESWYDSLGVPIGKLMLDFAVTAGITPGDTAWNDQIFASIDGVVLQELLADLDATVTTAKELAVAEGRYALMVRDYLGTSFNSSGKWETQWKNLRVFGRHGLPVYGSWPGVGLLASDIVAYALARWAPQIHFSTGANGTIRPTEFLIPHLVFKEPTTVAEMIQQATRYELPEWGVWPGQNGPTFYLNKRGQREGAKKWRVRSHEAEFEDTGQQLDKVFNGVIVQGQATDGSTIYIGPAGSGMRYTSERLLDTDPENPINELGPSAKRYAKIQMKGIATMEGMLEAGEIFLEQCKLLDGSGRTTLTGYVEDTNGVRWPYYCVDAGDEIEFIGSSIPGLRYIVNANRNRTGRSVSVDIDAPPDAFEAILEQLYAEYVGLALSNA